MGSPIFADHVPDSRPGRSSGSRLPAGSCSARPTRPSSAPAPTRSTRCSGPPAIRGTRRSPAAARPAARRWRLATGMAWLADGSDLGGSLRTPAAFCGVVGLRPSPGRVPHGPRALPFATLAVEGPMARDVRDVALFLDVLAGFDPRDPLSYDPPAQAYAETVERPVRARAGSPSRPISAASRRSIAEIADDLPAGGRLASPRSAPRSRKPRPTSARRPRCSRSCARRSIAANMAPLLEQHRDRAQARGGLEHRARPAPDRRRDRPGRARARPAAAAHGRVHEPLRPAAVPGRDRAAVPGRDRAISPS